MRIKILFFLLFSTFNAFTCNQIKLLKSYLSVIHEIKRKTVSFSYLYRNKGSQNILEILDNPLYRSELCKSLEPLNLNSISDVKRLFKSSTNAIELEFYSPSHVDALLNIIDYEKLKTSLKNKKKKFYKKYSRSMKKMTPENFFFSVILKQARNYKLFPYKTNYRSNDLDGFILLEEIIKDEYKEIANKFNFGVDGPGVLEINHKTFSTGLNQYINDLSLLLKPMNYSLNSLVPSKNVSAPHRKIPSHFNFGTTLGLNKKTVEYFNSAYAMLSKNSTVNYVGRMDDYYSLDGDEVPAVVIIEDIDQDINTFHFRKNYVEVRDPLKFSQFTLSILLTLTNAKELNSDQKTRLAQNLILASLFPNKQTLNQFIKIAKEDGLSRVGKYFLKTMELESKLELIEKNILNQRLYPCDLNLH